MLSSNESERHSWFGYTTCWQTNRTQKRSFEWSQTRILTTDPKSGISLILLCKTTACYVEVLLKNPHLRGHSLGLIHRRKSHDLCILQSNHCLHHCLHLSSLTQDFAQRRHHLQTFKELVKLSNGEIFDPSVVIFKEKIEKLEHFWMAKALMSSYILCKMMSF